MWDPLAASVYPITASVYPITVAVYPVMGGPSCDTKINSSVRDY